MKYFGIALSLISSLSFAETLVELEKKCFDAGNISFAEKTKEEVVVYGNEKDPKVSFVKYNVKNNPKAENGYPAQSFFMVNIPKSISNKLGIKSWNDYLCGSFLDFAYPNVNELTSFSTKGGKTSINFKEKFYGFHQRINKYEGVLTPESIDSISISIPGNIVYSNYPLSRIYPNDFVKNYDKQLFVSNKLLTKTIDSLIAIFLKNDFEARNTLVNELKQSNALLSSDIEFISNILNDFDDRAGTNENTDVYLTVYSFLETLKTKLEQVKPYMTATASAYTDVVVQFFQDFDKQANRYLQKIKKNKSKDTEKNLADYSTQSLVKAIGIVQKGIDGLGYTTDKTERQIAYVLSDYETKMNNYLESIKSGNIGTAKIVKPALAKYIVKINSFLDIIPCKYMDRNKEAKEADADVVPLDDGTKVMLFGHQSKERDVRILIRTLSSDISSFYFDKDMQIVGGSIGRDVFFYKDFLPSIQVVFVGKALNIKTFGNDAKLINESKFLEDKDLSSEKGSASREKLECVFKALKGDMKKFKDLVGTKVVNHGSLSMSVKNEKFQSLSCKDGVITHLSGKK